MMNEIKIKYLKEYGDLPKPRVATDGSAGLDLIMTSDNITLPVGRPVEVSLGISVAIPEGSWLGIYMRSGLAFKHGLALVNGVGVIDHDYRGEVKAKIVNLGICSVELERGDRICQAILHKINPIQLVEVEELDETSRGTGGFGSTGVK